MSNKRASTALLAALFSTMTGHAAWAAYVVTVGGDGADTSVGDCLCRSTLAGNPCTLRAAIQETHACPAGDITFAANVSTVTLAIAGRGETAGATGDLNVNASMTIGNPSTVVTVDGNYLDRVFGIGLTSGNILVYLKHLRIAHGRTTGTDRGGGVLLGLPGTAVKLDGVTLDTDESAYGGGGIALGKDTTATFENSSEIRLGTDTSASCQGGGGIYNAGGHVDLLGSSVVSCVSTCGDGAGILDLQGCDGSGACSNASLRTNKDVSGHETVIANNQGRNGGGLMNGPGSSADLDFAHFNTNYGANAYYGAAIFNQAATLDITDSTFDSNLGGSIGTAIADDDGTLLATRIDVRRCGGAVYIGPGKRVARIASSTFHENSGIYGAAVRTLRPTVVTASTFTDNDGYAGAAIYASGYYQFPVTLQVSGSTFTGNSTIPNGAYSGGGAILLDGKATSWIFDSVFSDNETDSGAMGGAVFVNDAQLLMQRVAITGNSSGKGGGLAIQNDASLATLINVTLSGNGAGTGGALYAANAATLSLNNITAYGNAANAGPGGALRAAGSGAVSFSNSIFGGNISAGTGPNCSGTVQSHGSNLMSATGGCSFTPQTGDILNTPPNLGPLTLVGSTYVHIPLGGSAAWNNANGSTSANLDQRGVARPLGPGWDIGAYEGP